MTSTPFIEEEKEELIEPVVENVPEVIEPVVEPVNLDRQTGDPGERTAPVLDRGGDIEVEKEEEKVDERPWWDKALGSAFIQATTKKEFVSYKLQQELPFTELLTRESKNWDTPQEAANRLGFLTTHAVLPDYLANTVWLGGTDMFNTAAKNILGIGKGNYVDKGFGWLDDLQRMTYIQGGFKDPAEWTQSELDGARFRSSLVLNGLLAIGTGGVGNLVAGSTALNASRFAFLAKGARFLDFTKAQSLKGGIVRFLAANAVDELPSTFLDDNSDNFFGSTAPGLTEWEQAQASFIPNYIGAGMLGGLFAAALNPKLVKSLPQRIGDTFQTAALSNDEVAARLAKQKQFTQDLFTERLRSLRSNTYLRRREEVRTNQVNRGLIREEKGKYTQGDLFKETAQSAESKLRAKVGNPQNQIESDALEETLKGNVSKVEAQEILERQEADESVIKVVDEVTTRTVDEGEIPSTEKFELRPKEEVDNQNFSDILGDETKESINRLLGNNPKLVKRIKKLTGKEVGKQPIDRLDIEEALKDIEVKDKETIVPQRDPYQEAVKIAKNMDLVRNAEDAVAAQRLLNAFNKASEAKFEGGLETVGDVLKLLNLARVSVEEGVQRGLRDFARVTTSISGRRLNIDEQIPPAKWLLVQARKDREELINKITKNAIEKGEARPPSTTLPQTPKVTELDVDKGFEDLANGELNENSLQLIDDEMRLIEQHGKIDAARKADELIAERKATRYENLTYEEKKKKGDLLPKKIEKPKPKAFELPDDLKRMKPRYGGATLEFDNELDQIAYIIRDNKKKSKREDDIVRLLKKQGYNPAEIKAHGTKVHAEVKRGVKAETGSASASPDNTAGLEFTVLDQKFQPSRQPRASVFKESEGETLGYNLEEERKKAYDAIENQTVRQIVQLEDYGKWIKDTVNARLKQSTQIALEARDAMRKAARMSGVPIENLKYVDEINMSELFGTDSNIQTIAKWEPKTAAFMKEYEDTDLVQKYLQARNADIGGLWVPAGFAEVQDMSIYLAFHPAINRRYRRGLKTLGKSGRPFLTTAAHEAFHAVQDILDILNRTKLQKAISTKEAIEEMTQIIKKGGGTFSEEMDAIEIQAEAFGIWFTNRDIKLTKGSPIRQAFERTKLYLQNVAREITRVLGRQPDWVDVFEMTAQGKFAKEKLKTQKIDYGNYIRHINARTHLEVPDLTWRALEYLEEKKFYYDNLFSKNNTKFNQGGCN